MNRPWKDEDEKPAIDFPVEQNGLIGKLKRLKKRFIKVLKAFNSVFGILLISTVFIFPYPSPGQALSPMEQVHQPRSDAKTLYIQEQSYNKVFDKFNESVEEGFCLFGEVNQTSIKVEKVLHAETVLLQTSTSINNMCLDEIKTELPSLYTDYGYKFLGKIHTHPMSNEAKPSLRDIHSLGKMSLFVEVTGVASNESINFYTEDQLGMGIPVQYY